MPTYDFSSCFLYQLASLKDMSVQTDGFPFLDGFWTVTQSSGGIEPPPGPVMPGKSL